MDLTRQMQSQPYPPLGINPRMTFWYLIIFQKNRRRIYTYFLSFLKTMLTDDSLSQNFALIPLMYL